MERHTTFGASSTHSAAGRRSLALHRLGNQELVLSDLCSGETWQAQTDAQGRTTITVPAAPGFRFLHYGRKPV